MDSASTTKLSQNQEKVFFKTVQDGNIIKWMYMYHALVHIFF